MNNLFECIRSIQSFDLFRIYVTRNMVCSHHSCWWFHIKYCYLFKGRVNTHSVVSISHYRYNLPPNIFHVFSFFFFQHQFTLLLSRISVFLSPSLFSVLIRARKLRKRSCILSHLFKMAGFNTVSILNTLRLTDAEESHAIR